MNTRSIAFASALAIGVVVGSTVAVGWAFRGGARARGAAGSAPPIACNIREVSPKMAARSGAPAAVAPEGAPPSMLDDGPARDLRLARGHTALELLSAAADGRTGDQLPARLEAILRADPEAVAPAVAFLRSGKAEKPVIEALGAAGTPPAQAGLCALARDASLPASVRQEALAGLVLVKQPTAPTMEAVGRLLEGRPTGVRRAARAVAGTVARFGRPEHVTESEAIEKTLLTEYARARDDEDRGLALAALANLGSPAVLASVKAALGDGERPVRAAAARALRLVPDPAADRLLVGLLRSDRDPAVRAAAIFAAGFRDVGPLVEGLAETAETDPVESVRTDTVTLLARYANSSPRATRALAYAADNDPKANVRQIARAALDRGR
ncbi:MAG TPA: HEAT repeat domain-containing protein [Polyangia bacterium]